MHPGALALDTPETQGHRAAPAPRGLVATLACVGHPGTKGERVWERALRPEGGTCGSGGTGVGSGTWSLLVGVVHWLKQGSSLCNFGGDAVVRVFSCGVVVGKSPVENPAFAAPPRHLQMGELQRLGVG